MFLYFFFFKQKTAYEMRISDWSSDVCSSDLLDRNGINKAVFDGLATPGNQWVAPTNPNYVKAFPVPKRDVAKAKALLKEAGNPHPVVNLVTPTTTDARNIAQVVQAMAKDAERSEEHTSELQSLMRISYAVFCLKKKKI